jgi:hypothetical protein
MTNVILHLKKKKKNVNHTKVVAQRWTLVLGMEAAMARAPNLFLFLF